MGKLKVRECLAYLLLPVALLMASCSNYKGVILPKYDGKPIKKDEKAINIYQSTDEIVGEEKEYYIRDTFSEDLPAGRATLLGNESSFTSKNYDIHVGNLSVYDADGALYFENLFHSEYGQLTAQFDLIENHKINIVGKEPEITVFYSEQLPKDPYVLMELPQLIQNLDRTDVQQPLEISRNKETVHLAAGIYEVGVHLESGDYILSGLEAPHSTELYLFRSEKEPRIIELLIDDSEVLDEEKKEDTINKFDDTKIELMDGDKLYLNLVNRLDFTRSDEN